MTSHATSSPPSASGTPLASAEGDEHRADRHDPREHGRRRHDPRRAAGGEGREAPEHGRAEPASRSRCRHAGSGAQRLRLLRAAGPPHRTEQPDRAVEQRLRVAVAAERQNTRAAPIEVRAHSRPNRYTPQPAAASGTRRGPPRAPGPRLRSRARSRAPTGAASSREDPPPPPGPRRPRARRPRPGCGRRPPGTSRGSPPAPR